MAVCERPESGRCAHCGGPAPAGRRCCSPGCARAWATEHVWGEARRAALARSGYACEECGLTDWEALLEVHHIVPVDPQVGYRTSCAHHRDNLVVLCEVHHAAVHRALRTPVGGQLVLVPAA